ncbi:hypothetical protein pipiens_008023 [Culex pipiens pipiens]|uniref:Uncharacterized protein n=1 Tax=Culex pipiens pipiens TaxID=38569 RepID=A0ABD1DJ43_CULPP
MFKILCLFALVSAIAANAIPMPSVPAPLPVLMRQARAAEMPTEPKEVQSTGEAAESADDMEKAETFGFGFHKHIYVSPSYGYGGYYPYSYGYGYGYPSYGYGGYGYPYYY